MPLMYSCGEKDSVKSDTTLHIVDSKLNGNAKTVKINRFSAIEKNGIAQKGKLIAEESWIFNSFGHITEHKNYIDQTITKYMFDKKKRFVGSVFCDFEGNLKPSGHYATDIGTRTEYEYVGNNKVKITEYNLEGDSIFGMEYEEDSIGYHTGNWGVSDFQYYNVRKSDETYVYIISDEQESWILRMTYIDGNITEITEREIEYYE